MKFCEAVISSLKNPLVIRREDICCLGAQRAFGFYQNDGNFASEILKETKIPVNFIQKAIIPILAYKSADFRKQYYPTFDPDGVYCGTIFIIWLNSFWP